jgi:hypothetical protein
MISLALATNMLSLLYADDTTLCNDSNNIDMLYEQTNLELQKAEAWFLANKLNLHPLKTKYMLFAFGRQQSCLPKA